MFELLVYLSGAREFGLRPGKRSEEMSTETVTAGSILRGSADWRLGRPHGSWPNRAAGNDI